MSIETTPDAQPRGSTSLARADERLQLDLLPFHAAGNDLLLILGLFYLLRLTSIPYSITEAIAPVSTQAGLALTYVVVHLVPIAALTLALTVLRRLPLATLGLASSPNSRDICAALGAGFGAWVAQFVLLWGLVALSRLTHRAFGVGLQFEHGDRQYMSALLPIDAIAFVVTGAIAEELLFRSLLLTRLRVVSGNWLVALVASAVVFTMGHDGATLAAIAPVFLGGLVLGWLFVATQSLPATVLAHVIYNVTWYFVWTTGATP